MKLEYPNYEIIVVDCGSTDGTPEMVRREFPKVRLLETTRIGIGEAINRGLALSKGDILAIDLNNDETVSPNWLDPLVKALRHEEVGVACWKRYVTGTKDVIDSAGDKIWFGIPYARGHGKRDSRKYNVATQVDCAPVIATRRDVLERVGQFDEEYFIYGEDADFCLRARKLGYKVVLTPDSTSFHRVSLTLASRSSRRLYWNVRARLLLLVKHYPTVPKGLLILFHATILFFINAAYYSLMSGRSFLSFARAEIRAIRDALTRKRTFDGDQESGS